MKTYKVDKAFEPTKLHAELGAAGITVITIRANFAAFGDTAAMYGLVVTDDAASDAAVTTAIAATVTTGTPSRSDSKTAKDAAFADFEKT